MFAWTTLRQKFSPLCLILIVTAIGNGCSSNSNRTKNSNNDLNGLTNADSRLATVTKRGKLICGVNGQLPGFSSVDSNGQYSGLDVDLCKAIAAALFDDPTKVEYRNLNAEERFSAVTSGKVDLLSRNTTWTLSRDTSLGMEFAPTTFYDGQGLLTTQASGIKTLEDLDNKSVCVLSGTTNQQNLADRMRRLSLNYSPIVFEDADLLYKAYETGSCDAATSDRSQLTIRRQEFALPDDHLVLSEVLSKEPLGPLVANGDSQWFDVVKWVIYALIEAEELGINSQNIDRFAQTKNPPIKRFLFAESVENNLGLNNDFALRIIKHVGNYGEIYDRNIGKPFNFERGLNALWKDGGLMHAPPFR
ncbi:amino acid ABC transporter substrate-binding protein [Waterburya agarophytonicola K14]|uniref:Amino acid ABC transporter substrate-binding protein n=1 Tax=Waterburya agarophytonicola KI4 TaxID=2874699 RepID=A0A964BQ99_9CYAN|nr:amino acid ABC transporter substrate-binding protein [Waterburya agarophytonicola]MCC0176161.1 amino acid ABC transporter substrate-binding protein [Waterburya agarophytonicola KI4]